MAKRIPLVAGALLVIATVGCPKKEVRPPPPPPTETQVLTPEVTKLSASAETLLREQDERLWRDWTTGQGAFIDESYAGYEGLFTAESIAKIERLRQLSEAPQQIRALTYLKTYFVGEYLAAALAGENEALANLEASVTFQVDGKEYPYRDLERLLAAEPNTNTRRALYDAATAAIQQLTPTLRRREDRIRQALGELKYPSYEAFGSELRQVELPRLGLLAEEILQLTAPAYAQTMDAISRKELALPFAQLRRADFPRLFQPRRVDAQFSKDGLLTRVDETLSGLGIVLGDLKNVRVDAGERKGKNPRPLVVAPKVPDDVRLSVVPAAGVRMQAAYLHEIGHALHLAFTREQRFELAKLGGNAQAEAFGFLFADLVEDPIWLEEKAGLSGEKLQAYLYATSAQKLYLVRRAAGQLLYQLELRRRGGEDARELYASVMTRAYGIAMTPQDAERYLVDSEDFFQSADEFRGWFLAAQLQGQLKARFGPRWWASREAGALLQKLWARGNAQSAREVAVELGEDGIRPDVLLLRVASTLNVPIRFSVETGAGLDGGVPPAADGGVPDGR